MKVQLELESRELIISEMMERKKIIGDHLMSIMARILTCSIK